MLAKQSVCMKWVFKLPNELCSKVKRNLSQKRKIHWINWLDLCKPKALGGMMNFKVLKCFNCALVEKQAWRIMCNPNSWVVVLLKSIYFKICNILQAKEGKNDSFFFIFFMEKLALGLLLYKGGPSIWGCKWQIE